MTNKQASNELREKIAGVIAHGRADSKTAGTVTDEIMSLIHSYATKRVIDELRWSLGGATDDGAYLDQQAHSRVGGRVMTWSVTYFDQLDQSWCRISFTDKQSAQRHARNLKRRSKKGFRTHRAVTYFPDLDQSAKEADN